MTQSFCVWLSGKTINDSITRIVGGFANHHPFVFAGSATVLSVVIPVLLDPGSVPTRENWCACCYGYGGSAEAAAGKGGADSSSPKSGSGTALAFTKVLFGGDSNRPAPGPVAVQALRALSDEEMSEAEADTLLRQHSNDLDSALAATRAAAAKGAL